VDIRTRHFRCLVQGSSSKALAWAFRFAYSPFVSAWASVASLDTIPQTYGAQFIRKLTSLPATESPSHSQSRFCIAALSLVLTELSICSSDRRQSHLDLMTAAYSLLSPLVHLDGEYISSKYCKIRLMGKIDRPTFDASMAKCCKLLSTTDYARILQFVVQTAEESKVELQQLTLLRLASIAIRDAPSGQSVSSVSFFK
jgi:hypothetical protein